MWKKICLGVAIVLALLYTVLFFSAKDAPQTALFERYPDFLSIAHQGGYLLAPSNTLYAFQQATELGVDMLEMDVHQTMDGKLVVIHDETVDRTTDGTGKVRDMTYSQLSKLDAGYRWLEDAPDGFKFRDKGIKIPLLTEVFRRFPNMPMTIEIKQNAPDISVALCQRIHDYNMHQQVIIGSFYQDALDRFRDACPGVATSMAKFETTLFVIASKLGLSSLMTPKGNALQVPMHSGGLQVVTKELLNDARRKGLKVHVWTINDPWTMRDLMALGVDGIITDRPDYLINGVKIAP